MEEPSVSFVIPVLNSENDIARCLLSIQNQKFPAREYEVLIIDNGSTDRTHQIIRSLGFTYHVVPQVHVSALRNRGVMMARGEYIAFVDSDVELTPQWLRNGLAGFTEQNIVASGCFPRVPKEATWVQRAWDLHQRGRKPQGKASKVAWLSSMNLIVRRNDFLAVAGFNEHLKTSEDVDLCYRLGQHGTILYNPAMEAVHWGEASDLKTFWRKEAWRGIGNLKGVLVHGLRWDELPSLGYPLYILSFILLLCLSLSLDLWYQQITLLPPCLVLLFLPALLLTWNTVRLTKQPRAMPHLLLLYCIYGFARAYSLFKS